MAESMFRSEKRERWERVVREWKESGLSGSAFCRERGIGYQSLLAWRRRFAAPDDETAAAGGGGLFQEFRLEDSGGTGNGCLEIVAGSFLIRVPPGIDPRDLRGVLSAVASVCAC